MSSPFKSIGTTRHRHPTTPRGKIPSSSPSSSPRAHKFAPSPKSRKRQLTIFRSSTAIVILFAGLLICFWLGALFIAFDSKPGNTIPRYSPLNANGFSKNSKNKSPDARHLGGNSREKTPQNEKNDANSQNQFQKHLPLSNTPVQHFQLSPPLTSTTETSSSSWSWPIINIVSTRFMQDQGNLVSLARSRLKLLEVVCLPSLLEQNLFNHTTLSFVYNHTRWGEEVMGLNKYLNWGKHGGNVPIGVDSRSGISVDPLLLWVIKVDPNLDKTVLDELKAVLEPVKHFTLVVGSLTNYGIGVKPGGWRDGQAGQDILGAFRDGRVFFPEDESGGHAYNRALNMIQRAHEARNDRVILESRLDADDAVNVDYFAVLHYSALKFLVDRSVSGFIADDLDSVEDNISTNNQTTSDSENRTDANERSKAVPNSEAIKSDESTTARWMYWCPERHIQWTPSSDTGSPDNDPGTLVVYRVPHLCVTPGLTLGFAVGTDEEDVPRYEHTKIFWEIAYNHKYEGGKELVRGTEEYKNNCGLVPSENCAVFMQFPSLGAFRSRAITSAGMHNIESQGQFSDSLPENYSNFSLHLWDSMEDEFGIIKKSAKEAANFMVDILVDTVRDNLRGQCTHGHSCKLSSMEKLQRSIDVLEEQINGLEVPDYYNDTDKSEMDDFEPSELFRFKKARSP